VDELAKLGSSRAMVPTGVFLQELHEPSISKALAKATKAANSSQETPPPSENVPECHTPFRDSGNEASIRVPRMFHSHV
jgi:hypothetical protein